MSNDSWDGDWWTTEWGHKSYRHLDYGIRNHGEAELLLKNETICGQWLVTSLTSTAPLRGCPMLYLVVNSCWYGTSEALATYQFLEETLALAHTGRSVHGCVAPPKTLPNHHIRELLKGMVWGRVRVSPHNHTRHASWWSKPTLMVRGEVVGRMIENRFEVSTGL